MINDRYQITLPWTTDRTIILPPFRKWENLPAGFKQLKLDKMDGKNLMNKIELLMAALSNSQWCESDHVNYMYEDNQAVAEIKYTSFPTMTRKFVLTFPTFISRVLVGESVWEGPILQMQGKLWTDSDSWSLSQLNLSYMWVRSINYWNSTRSKRLVFPKETRKGPSRETQSLFGRNQYSCW